MKKSNLQAFINRYHLGGSCEAVTVSSTANGVECDLIDNDKTVIGNVKWKVPTFLDGEMGVSHTSSLNKLLAAIQSELEIEVVKEGGKNYKLIINEGSTKLTFMLSDTTVIPAVPKNVTEPPYDLTIPLDAELIEKYIRSKNAMSDARNFGIQVKNGIIKLIINHNSVESDHITFDIGKHDTDMTVTCFEADKFKEILTANKGSEGKLSVAKAGLAKIEFETEDFESKYFLVQLK